MGLGREPFFLALLVLAPLLLVDFGVGGTQHLANLLVRRSAHQRPEALALEKLFLRLHRDLLVGAMG